MLITRGPGNRAGPFCCGLRKDLGCSRGYLGTWKKIGGAAAHSNWPSISLLGGSLGEHGGRRKVWDQERPHWGLGAEADGNVAPVGIDSVEREALAGPEAEAPLGAPVLEGRGGGLGRMEAGDDNGDLRIALVCVLQDVEDHAEVEGALTLKEGLRIDALGGAEPREDVVLCRACDGVI